MFSPGSVRPCWHAGKQVVALEWIVYDLLCICFTEGEGRRGEIREKCGRGGKHMPPLASEGRLMQRDGEAQIDDGAKVTASCFHAQSC